MKEKKRTYTICRKIPSKPTFRLINACLVSKNNEISIANACKRWEENNQTDPAYMISLMTIKHHSYSIN